MANITRVPESLIPSLVEFREDPRDVSGNSYTYGRTPDTTLWSTHTRNPGSCVAAGSAVVRELMRYEPDLLPDGALIQASNVAVQQPPLLGTHLVRFLEGAQMAIDTAFESEVK